MSRRPLIAGNWKMNKTPQESEEFILSLLDAMPSIEDCDVLLIPPYTSLDRAGMLLADRPLLLGAQDLHVEASGAFTGAVSGGMLTACGCEFVLVGHSERRHVFGDCNEIVNRKLKAALAGNLWPILCIGETLEQRRAEHTQSVLEKQLEIGLAEVTGDHIARCIIAYEPVWAIGTGETATPQQAQAAIRFVRSWVDARYGRRMADVTRILYGGSVKPDNAASLQSQPDIDGALVGGASLDPASFGRIIGAVQMQQGKTAC